MVNRTEIKEKPLTKSEIRAMAKAEAEAKAKAEAIAKAKAEAEAIAKAEAEAEAKAKAAIIAEANAKAEARIQAFDFAAKLDSDNAKAYDKRIARLEQSANRVTFKSGNNGIVRVIRFNQTVNSANNSYVDSESLAMVNRLNKVHGLQFSRVFVADYRTVYKGESLVRRLGIIGIVESDKGKRAYLLGSTWQAVIKTSTESLDKLELMLQTVTKAIKLATDSGLYDNFNMSYDDSAAKDKGEIAFVNTPIEF